MGDDVGKRVRLVLGLVIPGLVALVLVGAAVLAALRSGDWGFVGAEILMLLVLLGPFFIYYFVLRTAEFSIAIGALLVATATYAAVDFLRATDRGSSTAALAVLWVPMIGYPVVAVGAFLDV
ncbi:MAG: hypothetical protein M3N53_06110 [Actinomycetota bacterium]|nr:hypothetical protein [Actinomycetota bacterium]